MKKHNIVEWAMHYRQIIILLVSVLMAFGIYGLSEMGKNEFPNFTIRQGIVAVAYPGATAAEIEEQVTKPLENYIFSYKEVKKRKTFSYSKDGMAIVQVELNDNLNNKDEFWSKFKHGINQFKRELPSGVAAVVVMDDFGDTSAMLITIESNEKTFKELKTYMDGLKDRLRKIESIGRMNVLGMRKEQISIYLDNKKLSQYGINEETLAVQLFIKGFKTTAGRIKSDNYTSPIYVSKSFNTVRDVQEMIVYSDPKGNNIRLKDIANVVKEYNEPESYITNNGKKCLLLSVEMKDGQNIVKMGDEINKTLDNFKKEVLPPEVQLFKITDQSQVVEHSVENFLHELLIAIAAVVIVVMLLLPLRVAVIAASTIPITIFISLGLFYAFGIELNTVTLAALIVTLGMIVDNSIVIIDNYLEKISEGLSRWNAAIQSATHFFKSIFSATMAISITFFPFLFTMKGMTHDFLMSFPWAITLILLISLLVAELVVPFLMFYFIRKPLQKSKKQKKSFSFLDFVQSRYDKILNICFMHPRIVIAIGLVSVAAGILLLGKVPQKLMPVAERNQFAVEIEMPTGTSLKKTALIADSLEHILRKDTRIVSIASFKGASSPRFQTSYAPRLGGTNFAQFIVNTTDNKATVEVLNEYTPKYSTFFPEAVVRFKQLGYGSATNPIEIRISGDSLSDLKREAHKIEQTLRTLPELDLIRTDFNEQLAGVQVTLDEDQSNRLGITNGMLASTLASRYSNGITLATTWQGDYDMPIVLKSDKSDSASINDVQNELMPAYGGMTNIPLRQVAQITPVWQDGQIVRRNGIRTISVIAEVKRNINVMNVTSKVEDILKKEPMPKGVTLTYGGDYEENGEETPHLIGALLIAIGIIYFILIGHFKRISTATLLLASLSLCFFGTAAGIWIQGVDLSMTCILGIVSLMGILVRNGIIMIDYAEELRSKEKMSVRNAIYYSAKRRMRPIFLTSAAASVGVIPMILGGSGLWMPMGTVIFYGTLITMVFILTVLPVSYWMLMKKLQKQRLKSQLIENEFA